MSLDLIYSGLSALIPLANDGHVPVELLTGPTKKVLISLFKTRSVSYTHLRAHET